ncbi:MAG TPA: DEAD/DEAH box helicase, partial [Rugosimonospora sp.]|nr:DEAD/DEAH box helicase [Rugosimonospora sp.]
MAVRRSPLTFHSFDIPAAVAAALAAGGITTPTPIQRRTLPDALAGRDVLGRGQTGSGKTYAFLVPLVTRLAAAGRQPAPRRPRALVLVPTRELANQVQASLAPIAAALSLRSTAIFGGVAESTQISALRGGVDIVIACPGRLAALVEAGRADLGAVEITVLDEADHMADLGFLPVVRRLLAATPRGGQRLLFSATLDHAVDALVRQFLRDPVTHEVDAEATPV